MSDLEKILAKAAKIVQKLPENLQEVAFNRVLDELLDGTAKELGAKSRGNLRRGARPKPASKKAEIKTESDNLLNAIDRTKYLDIGATDRVADQALKVLQLVNEDYDIDGLTALQISEILNKNFRLPATKKAVFIALQRESKTVNVQSGPGGKKIFHIMAPGDDYLKRLRAGEIEAQAHHGNKTAKKKAKKKSTVREKAVSKKKARGKTAKRKSTTLGPKAAIERLIETGFLSSPRQIAEIREELKHSKGHTFSVQELSPTLLRCVRDETLNRSRNDSGQYEYSKA